FPTRRSSDLIRDGVEIAASSPGFYEALQESIERSLDLHEQIRRIERGEVGSINTALERLRLDERRLELDQPEAAIEAAERARIAAARELLDAQYSVLRTELDALYDSTRRDTLRMQMGDGNTVDISLALIMRATTPNAMSVTDKLIQYVERLWEFLTDDPREANTEGGIFPAIFGTVTMVLLM